MRKGILKHRKDYYVAKLFRRVSADRVRGVLGDLGVTSGETVFVHSAFSKLGYFPPGPEGFVELLREAVGNSGTILMPAFSFDGAMEDYVSSEPVFDLKSTPSRSGYLTEVFRTLSGVRRSLHPTHSVCALGARASEAVSGHERSLTPCGPDSPFGRLAYMGAWVLRMGTGSLTLYHHLQEMAHFPNVFLPETRSLSCIDGDGKPHEVRTRVYRKLLPGIVFLGKAHEKESYSVHPSDFPLLYSGDREQRLRNDPQRGAALRKLLDIRETFEAKGWLRKVTCAGVPWELFRVAEYVKYALNEYAAMLEDHRDRYDLTNLRRLYGAGMYPRRK